MEPCRRGLSRAPSQKIPLADETEKLNLIQYDPAKLIFPPKAKIDRGNTEIEKDSLFGPSIRMR